MADGVHLAINQVQPGTIETVLDRTATEAKGEQLTPGDYSVLAGGEGRDGRFPLTWVV